MYWGLVPPAGFEPAPLGLGKFAKPSTQGITRHLWLHAGLLGPPLTSVGIAVSFPKPFPAGGAGSAPVGRRGRDVGEAARGSTVLFARASGAVDDRRRHQGGRHGPTNLGVVRLPADCSSWSSSAMVVVYNRALGRKVALRELAPRCCRRVRSGFWTVACWSYHNIPRCPAPEGSVRCLSVPRCLVKSGESF